MSLASFGGGDGREDAKLKARQARDAERRDRLLDARSRTMSCDKKALDAQRRAKRAKAKAEKQEAARAAQQQNEWGRSAAVMQMDQMQQARQAQMQLSMEWKKQSLQRASNNSTWDLNDPNRLKNAQPARVGDSDPRLGPASMQIFAGEAQGQQERIAQEQANLSAFLQQQIAEKRAREASERDNDRSSGQNQVALCNMVAQQEYEASAREQRRIEDLANQNRALANQNRRNRRAQQAQDDALSQLEMQYQAKNKMLRDDSSQGASALGDHRVRRDHYKGMGAEERRQIFEDQARQREELQANRDRERREKTDWEAGQADLLRQMKAMEADQMRASQQNAMQHRAQLELQKSQNTKARKAAKLAAGPDVTADYFDSFQAGGR